MRRWGQREHMYEVKFGKKKKVGTDANTKQEGKLENK